jgi:phage RecT family recombinase
MSSKTGTGIVVLDQALDDRALPSRFNGNRFDKEMRWAAEKEYARQVIAANQELQDCTPESIRSSMLEVAWSGMSLATSLGHAYLIPYRDPARGIRECTFKPGYRGLAYAAMQGGAVSDINGARVFSQDKFRVYTENNRRIVDHEEDWKITNRGKVIAVWSIAKLPSGGERVEVTPWEIIEAAEAAAKAKNPKGGFAWKGKFRDQMELKVSYRRLLKLVPGDARGWLKHGLEVVDKHDGIDFDKAPASAPGDQELCLSDQQVLELEAVLSDHSITGQRASNWLKNMANHYNATEVRNIPARYFEDAKTRLAERCRKAGQ